MPTPRTPAEHQVERVDWRELGPHLIEVWGHRDGHVDPEGVTVYGPSGSGKSTMLGHLAMERNRRWGSHVIYVATKKTDSTIAGFGWPITDRFPPNYGQDCVIFWAKAKGITAATRVEQKAKVKRLMNQLWVPESNRLVIWDEVPYLEGSLGLKTEMETFYREGRTLGITNMTGAQRPAGMNRYVHSENVITIAFRPKDADDRDRVAEVFGDRAYYRIVLSDLNRQDREFLIKDERSGEVYISRLVRRTSVRRTGVR